MTKSTAKPMHRMSDHELAKLGWGAVARAQDGSARSVCRSLEEFSEVANELVADGCSIYRIGLLI